MIECSSAFGGGLVRKTTAELIVIGMRIPKIKKYNMALMFGSHACPLSLYENKYHEANAHIDI